MNKNAYIGLMSGTSLDGLDIASCTFSKTQNYYSYEINNFKTVPYKNQLKQNLKSAYLLSASDLVKLDKDYAIFISNSVNKFIQENNIYNAKLIASHGHTVFHEPNSGINLQIGNGAVISKNTQLPVVCDFRSGDIALGGQGAPLVPIGDRLLFSNYDACLNLGGFSNISFENNNNRIAYDICPVNIILNQIAQLEKLDYDKDGEIAKKGKMIEPLYNQLNNISYYSQSFPKSLSREWLDNEFLPLVKEFSNHSTEDIMHTLVKHISYQISTSLKNCNNVLITGGGAFNKYLINNMENNTRCKIIIPEEKVVNYKEALVFAFLGYLRWNNQVNCLSTVTGAKKDSCIGAVYL